MYSSYQKSVKSKLHSEDFKKGVAPVRWSKGCQLQSFCRHIPLVAGTLRCIFTKRCQLLNPIRVYAVQLLHYFLVSPRVLTGLLPDFAHSHRLMLMLAFWGKPWNKSGNQKNTLQPSDPLHISRPASSHPCNCYCCSGKCSSNKGHRPAFVESLKSLVHLLLYQAKEAKTCKNQQCTSQCPELIA